MSLSKRTNAYLTYKQLIKLHAETITSQESDELWLLDDDDLLRVIDPTAFAAIDNDGRLTTAPMGVSVCVAHIRKILMMIPAGESVSFQQAEDPDNQSELGVRVVSDTVDVRFSETGQLILSSVPRGS